MTLKAWTFSRPYLGFMTVAGLLSLLVFRKTAPISRIVMIGVAVGVSWIGSQLHSDYLREQRLLAEKTGLARWEGKELHQIRYLHAYNPEREGEGLFSLGTGSILVNFWATWCSPCLKEMPMLDSFWQRNRDRGVEIVGVTGEGTAFAIRDFLKDQDVSYPVLLLDKELFGSFHIERFPSTLWVQDGRVRSFHVGIDGTEELLAQIESQLP